MIRATFEGHLRPAVVVADFVALHDIRMRNRGQGLDFREVTMTTSLAKFGRTYNCPREFNR